MRGQANVTESAIGTPSQFLVTTSSAIVLPANTKRSYAVFCNTDATNDIYLCRGKAAIVGNGILLKAGGGSYEILATNLFRGNVYGISVGASVALAIEEDV